LCLAVLGPAKEREMSYYRYWDAFIHHLDDVVEPVPLNRFAHNAIDRTFNNIATSVIFQQIIHQKRVNLWENVHVLRAIRPGEELIDENILCQELGRIYREDEDAADIYRHKVRECWTLYKTTLRESDRTGSVSETFQRRGPNEWMMSLRGTDRTVELAYSDIFQTVKDHSSHSTLSADDETDPMSAVSQEEEELEERDSATERD
jgi:hypothetical protein